MHSSTSPPAGCRSSSGCAIYNDLVLVIPVYDLRAWQRHLFISLKDVSHFCSNRFLAGIRLSPHWTCHHHTSQQVLPGFTSTRLSDIRHLGTLIRLQFSVFFHGLSLFTPLLSVVMKNAHWLNKWIFKHYEISTKFRVSSLRNAACPNCMLSPFVGALNQRKEYAQEKAYWPTQVQRTTRKT